MVGLVESGITTTDSSTTGEFQTTQDAPTTELITSEFTQNASNLTDFIIGENVSTEQLKYSTGSHYRLTYLSLSLMIFMIYV